MDRLLRPDLLGAELPSAAAETDRLRSRNDNDSATRAATPLMTTGRKAMALALALLRNELGSFDDGDVRDGEPMHS